MPHNIEYPKVTIKDVLREYYNIAKHYWRLLLGILVTIVVTVIASNIIVPLYYKHFFDILSQKDSVDVLSLRLVHTIFIIFILNVIGWTGNRIQSFAMVHLETDIMNRLRQTAYEYVIGHSYSFFSNTFSGSLVQKINRYMRSFERIMDRIVGEIIPILLKVVGICIVLWTIKPFFVYMIVGWFFLYLALAVVFSRWKMPYDIHSAEVESRASAALADSISNHATIQSFNRFSHESALFGQANTTHTTALKKKWNAANIIDSIQGCLNIGIEFLVFYIAIKFWGGGFMTIGTFVLIQIYILNLMDNFWASSRILRDLYESFGDAKEMVEILKLSHGIKDASGSLSLKVTAGNIVFKDLCFSFNSGKDVLSGITLDISAGERIALIGPSGAGKSTLVRLLLRLYDINSGSISIDGQDISKVTQGSLREAISFVPQDPILFHRTLMDNIRYGKTDATDAEVIEASKLAHCHEFISSQSQGYETFVGERGIKLSGGERQRVAIARAILKNAPILILDEATSSLDSRSEVLIQDALENLMKGKTVIVIAHRLSTIRKMNRIIVLENGKILEQGTHDSLIEKNGLYAKLWSLQSQGFIHTGE